MHRRPTLPNRTTLIALILLASLSFGGVLLDARPSAAAWEGSKTEDAAAKIVDAVLIRPLSVVRVFVGAGLLVPSSVFAAPSGREGLRTAYDVLIIAPMEYAFKRKLGDF